MSESPIKRRPTVRTTSGQTQPAVPPPSYTRDMRDPRNMGGMRHTSLQRPPAGRDPFPYIMAALVGLMLIGLAVASFLVGSIISQPQAGSLPAQANPNSGSFANSTDNTKGVPTGQPGAANTPAGGDSLPGVAVPSEGQAHVPEGQAITYQSYPPSSGTHYATTVAYGFSDKEIPEGNLVHDLEHGAIVLYYKPDLPSAVLQSLRDTATKLPIEKYGKVKIVIAPYSKLQTAMAIAAWGRLETLQSFDYEKIRIFYEALVDHGPEDVP